jgi:hypothetical protein
MTSSPAGTWEAPWCPFHFSSISRAGKLLQSKFSHLDLVPTFLSTNQSTPELLFLEYSILIASAQQQSQQLFRFERNQSKSHLKHGHFDFLSLRS